MPPIYLPAHRVDTYELAKWSFKATALRFLPLYILLSFCLAMALQTLLLLPVPFAVLFGVLIFVLINIAMYIRLRKLYNAPNRSQFRFSRTVVLDDNFMQIDYENGLQSRMPWSIIYKVTKTRELMVFYTTMGTVFPMPTGILTADALALIERATKRTNAPPLLPNAL